MEARLVQALDETKTQLLAKQDEARETKARRKRTHKQHQKQVIFTHSCVLKVP